MDRLQKPLVLAAFGFAILSSLASGSLKTVLAVSVFFAAAPLWAWHLRDMIRSRRAHQ
ncbi:MAG TPA: hypothetical protein VNA87_05880 [Actinomycetota bacterium]|nr:hypothetical protein [Actinomycetota bacterium]